MTQLTSRHAKLFEVALLPGARRPQVANLQRDEARQAFPAPDFAFCLRPANEVGGAG